MLLFLLWIGKFAERDRAITQREERLTLLEQEQTFF